MDFQPNYGQQPVYRVPPVNPPVVYPDCREETDPAKPLWRAVIGQLLPAEWQTLYRRGRTKLLWCFVMAAVLVGYLGLAAIDDATVPIGGLEVPRFLFFIPLHMVLFAVAIGRYLWLSRREKAEERWQMAVYGGMETAGREVTVYCDRIEAVGAWDTVTVPFEGATVWESRAVLVVEKGADRVAVRAADLTSEQVAVLRALLAPRVSDRRGGTPLCSYRHQVPLRPAPQPVEDGLLYTARYRRSVKSGISLRFQTLLGEQGLVWMPLLAITALLITECWAPNNYFLLYYITTLLSVFVISLLVMAVAVKWDVQSDPTWPQTGELCFYGRRLVIRGGGEQRVYPKELVRLTLSEDTLEIGTSTGKQEFLLSELEDPAGLRAFLGGD